MPIQMNSFDANNRMQALADRFSQLELQLDGDPVHASDIRELLSITRESLLLATEMAGYRPHWRPAMF